MCKVMKKLLTITIAIILLMPKGAFALRPMATRVAVTRKYTNELMVYEKIEKFLSHQPTASWPEDFLLDGTVYGPTPCGALYGIFSAIEERLGNLEGKLFLDFGAGDLRASLFATNLFGMNAIAVEKDPVISDGARKVFATAREQGLANNLHFLPITDALKVSWVDVDAIFFFYTQPPDKAEEFRRQLQNKMKEAKNNSILAILFTEAQIMHEFHIFDDLQPLEKDPICVGFEQFGLYVQFYRSKHKDIRSIEEKRAAAFAECA